MTKIHGHLQLKEYWDLMTPYFSHAFHCQMFDISNTGCSMLQFKCFLLNLTVWAQSSPNHPKTVIHSGWGVYS
jgi:hypothetical protein